jgi:hypothetical protein
MIQQLTTGLATGAALVGAWIPKLIAFGLILLIGWAIARGLQAIVKGVLQRVGFDRLVERGGVKRAMSRSKYDAAGLLARIVFWAAMLFVFQLAFGVFGPNPVSGLIASIVGYLPLVFAAALIVVIGAAVAAAARELIDAALGGLSYGRAVADVAAGAIIYVTAIAALSQLNIAPAIVNGLFYATLAAIAGILIVAVGGGGIPVMTDWWRRGSTRVEQEAPQIAQQTQGAQERIKQRSQERMEQAKQKTGMGGGQQSGEHDGQRTAERQPVGTATTPPGTTPPRPQR